MRKPYPGFSIRTSSLAKFIDAFCIDHDLERNDIADAIGVSHKSLWSYLVGQRTWTVYHITSFLKEFGGIMSKQEFHDFFKSMVNTHRSLLLEFNYIDQSDADAVASALEVICSKLKFP